MTSNLSAYMRYRALAFICLGLFLFSNKPCFAQQPGGVNGTKVWYVSKQDKPNYLIDISGNNYSFLKTTAKIDSNLNINFQPATFFTGSAIIKSISNFKANAITSVGIFYPSVKNTNTTQLIKLESTDYSYTIHNNQVDSGKLKKYSFGNPQKRTTFQIQPSYTTIANAMKPGVWYLSGKKPNHSIWGEKFDVTLASSFTGYIPELILYERHLSNDEVRRIQSYLSIKYGTTLDTSYFNSEGKVIWNINDSILKKFHYRVCAIGKDTISGLWQPKSNSTYEDNRYAAYDNDADKSTTVKSSVFIPKTDFPSIYRSLTIEFLDKNPKSIPDNQFIFWGDNARKIDTVDISHSQIKVNKKDFPYLKIITDRQWLIYNKDNLTNKTKLVIAGAEYKSSNSLFNKLYKPYDYQRYRYVLLTILKDSVVKVQLNSYFGREWFELETFSTRTIVWDSTDWKNESSPYHFFTFGKVPVLNILEIGKASEKNNSIKLRYPYYKDSAISNDIIYDTLSKALEIKTNDKVAFTIPGGLKITTLNISVLVQGKWILLPANVISRDGDPIVANSDISEDGSNGKTADSLSKDIETNNTTYSSPPGKKNPNYSEIERQPPYRPSGVTKYLITTDKLYENNTFLIEIKDALGQCTQLPFKTQKPKVPKTH
ncbi:MAG: hypothetical protein EOO87_00225 [Pedobacter sp.]|nr:MAG: hypothetical protein EOO87_00225 [Pedobacter sp.]